MSSPKLIDSVKNKLKDISEENDLYSSETQEPDELDEQEQRILSWLNENNVLMTNSSEKMYRFFQMKREKILEVRRQLRAHEFSPEKHEKQEDTSVKKTFLKDYAKRKSLFLLKI